MLEGHNVAGQAVGSKIDRPRAHSAHQIMDEIASAQSDGIYLFALHSVGSS